MRDQFAWHNWARKAGRFAKDRAEAIRTGKAPPPPDAPHIVSGFFRVKARGGELKATAIWRDGPDEEPVCCDINGQPWELDAANHQLLWDMMPNISNEVISAEEYWAFVNGGCERWPDQPESTVAAFEHDINTHEGVIERLKRFRAEAAPIIAKGAAKDKTAADLATTLHNRFLEVEKAAEGQREVEKKPHWDAYKAVQAKWVGLVDEAKGLKEVLFRQVINPYLMLEKRREEFEAAKARAEAEAAQPPGENAPLPAEGKIKVTAGPPKGKVTPREYWIAKITDREAFLAAVKDREDITVALQKIADWCCKNGRNPMPGLEYFDTSTGEVQ